MRKTVFILILVIAAFTIIAHAEDASYGVPPHFKVTDYIAPIAENAWSHPFYPVGWSKDGKFAYITTYLDDMAGGPFFFWTVQDMVTDEVLWVSSNVNESMRKMEERYSSMTAGEKEEERKAAEEIRRKYGQLDEIQMSFHLDVYRSGGKYAEKLASYGIIPGQNPSPQRFPMDFEGGIFTTEIVQKKMADVPGFDGYRAYIEYDVTVSRQGGQSKIIMKYRGDSYGPVDVQAPLYFRSPFQPRIAVLITTMAAPFHGEFNYRYSFSGCNMKVGF